MVVPFAWLGRERTFIHVGGPPGAGKTAFIEALIRANATSAVTVARCARDDRVDDDLEWSSPSDPEILRFGTCTSSGHRALPWDR
jgi:Ni2+-binding GTPase involved in maturation of urease and hydrogenase